LGGVLSATIKEELERVVEEDQISQLSVEASFSDLRRPARVQGEAAVGAPLSDGPVTTL
jgi:hypothetical protein